MPDTARVLARIAIVALSLLALGPAAPGPASAKRPIKFGTTSTTDPYSDNTRAITATQARFGRPVDIVHWYQSWGGGSGTTPFSESWVGAVLDSQRTPLLTWEPWDARSVTHDQPAFRLRRIADGAYDAYIADWAQRLWRLDRTVYLRPMHEFNGSWYPWSGAANGNTPRDFRAAWRHMRRVFSRHGATRVKWVWSVNALDVPAGNRMEDYYPGDRLVDVLALDGYNWGTSEPGHGGWRTFSEIAVPAYRRLAKIGPQPIWVTETASDHRGGSKPEWIRDMFRTARELERLRAIVWFDEDKERDWRLDSSRDVARAFRR